MDPMSNINAKFVEKFGISSNFFSERHTGRFTIYTYDDGSEWVKLVDKQKERFCGYLYLQQSLEDSNLTNFQAAENRIALHDRNPIYLSKYYGDEKPRFTDNEWNDIHRINNVIGFKDVINGCNLRKIEDKIYIFDTESNSFREEVKENIDECECIHDMILQAIEMHSESIALHTTQKL